MAVANQSNSVLPESALRQALAACRSSFLAAGLFSLFINLLLLMPTLYMLQIYDRVLASSSESTLLMLTLIALFLFLVMGGLDWVRAQILVVTGTRLDHLLGPRVFDSVFKQSLASGGKVATAQPLNDLLNLRQFMTGQGLFAFFDAPWLPIYIGVMFIFEIWQRNWRRAMVLVGSGAVVLAACPGALPARPRCRAAQCRHAPHPWRDRRSWSKR